MSNLGWYQIMTKAAKKVGGPINLLAIVAGGGYVTMRLGEAGIKKGIKIVHNKLAKSANVPGNELTIYDVTSNGRDDNGLVFSIGDKFRVLETDSDSILIEKIDDADNPYFTSRTFLSSISTFC